MRLQSKEWYHRNILNKNKTKNKMENCISVRSDIVIPNELILVHYEGGEIALIFYDELRLPNFTHWMPLPKPPVK